VGDWAVALRSPEGTVVARVCPFDPAYRAFVDLCRKCAGNRWLPRIELAADLEGGGSVVFLEFAAPVDHAVAEQVAEQWRTAAGDAEFREVRRAAQMIDAGYRKSTPWWGRCDLNEAHIRRAADGRLVLIDVFCMDGASLYRKILEDVAGVHRRIPRERMRYALDIPYIARESSTAEILALKRPGHAWADDRSRVCQGTAADAPSRSRTTDLPPQSAHILAAATCARTAGRAQVEAAVRDQ
jgi:hypothetical protein